MSNASEKIIAKIESEKIKPRPQWQFSLKKYSVLALTVIALILGSLSFSLVLYLINNQDWGLQTISRSRFIFLIFMSLPFAWLVFLILFIAFIFFNFRQLRNGYKYPMRTIVATACLTIIILGSLAAGLGLHRQLHQMFSRQIPFYQTTFDPRHRLWIQPQKGFLAGQITAHQGDDLYIIDPLSNDWHIDITKRTVVAPELKLEPNEEVKIIGIIIRPGDFDAQEIRPWERSLHPGQAPDLFRNRPQRPRL